MTNMPVMPKELLARMQARRRARPLLESDYVSPRDSVEENVADIWREVMGLDEVGVHDNFFALGGDSLQMTRIASRLRDRFAADLSFDDFFDAPTVAGLSELLRIDCEPVVQTSVVEKSEPQAFPQNANTVTVTRTGQPASFREEADVATITSVVIPTRGRPAALKRCLDALRNNLEQYGRSARVVIADATPGGSAAEGNRSAAQDAMLGTSNRVVFIGVEERQAILNRLAVAGFGDLARFALQGSQQLGEGDGANRNLLQLMTGGEAFLSIDDDTECRFACSPSYKDGLLLETGRRRLGDEPAEIWLYPNRDAVLSSVRLSSIDVLNCHHEILGRPVAQLAAGSQNRSRLTAEEWERVRDCDARVVVSLHGLVGDCGWGSPSPYLFVGDSSFARLTSSNEDYRSGTASREMLRIPSSFVVSEEATNLMSTAFAADNRRCLPPWAPVGRGADVVFGQTLKRTDAHAWFGHVPWAMLHAPIEKRRFWPGEVLRSAATTDIRNMLCALLADCSTDVPASPEDNLRRAGRSLLDIGKRSSSAFCDALLACAGAYGDMEVAILQNRLAQVNGAREQCSSDIAAYIEKRKLSRNQLTAAIPAELLYGRTVEQAANLARETVCRFGDLLCSWSDLTKFFATFKDEVVESCSVRGQTRAVACL